MIACIPAYNKELLDNDILLGYDGEGKIVSVEILDASKKRLLNAFLELAKTRRDTVNHLLSKIVESTETI